MSDLFEVFYYLKGTRIMRKFYIFLLLISLAGLLLTKNFAIFLVFYILIVFILVLTRGASKNPNANWVKLWLGTRNKK